MQGPDHNSATFSLLDAAFEIIHEYPQGQIDPRLQYMVDNPVVCRRGYLEAKWPTFVYFALGFGVNPSHGLDKVAGILRTKTPLQSSIR